MKYLPSECAHDVCVVARRLGTVVPWTEDKCQLVGFQARGRL